ncbi:TPA: aminotransferase [Streptococcus suis]|uniref:aminotransferase n=1 Tax=Streptococcus suis TaxID=1307 RepID=UPI0014794EEE|nr:aminotransferase [Streptococcus suis]MDY7595217.1 aminotransferase [Streptococcus suis]NRG74121.1 aminotransferase [Streptococcus suis]WNF68807.1 aminotransferase [Streptococcus suis]HEL1579705.1 aminotransferase [Streptococcus suis]HEL1656668.1 aminotransferase [Streptococcus suis]
MKLPRFGVEEWLNVHENSAIYDIAGVSISSLTLEELFALSGTNPEDFYKKLQGTKLNYGWIEGSLAFKKSVSQLYTGVKPEQILQTNGATEANLLVLYSLIEPGDHVISLYPTYQQLYDIPKSLGAEVDLWQIEEENGWLPDLEKLRQLIRPNTKMICINNANNPTGAVMDRTYLEELVEIASEVGAYILSDEVYRSFSGLDVPSIIEVYDKGIAVNSLSKTYSLPGIRVGWVAANHQVTDILRDYRDYTMICAGVFDDMVAQLALASRKEILKRNRRILEENLAILDQWIEEEPRVSYIRPAVVSTSFVKIAVEMPMEEFCLQLLQEHGVLLVPGNRFNRDGYVRLGFACEQETLIKGLEKLSQFLRRFDKEN